MANDVQVAIDAKEDMLAVNLVSAINRALFVDLESCIWHTQSIASSLVCHMVMPLRHPEESSSDWLGSEVREGKRPLFSPGLMALLRSSSAVLNLLLLSCCSEAFSRCRSRIVARNPSKRGPLLPSLAQTLLVTPGTIFSSLTQSSSQTASCNPGPPSWTTILPGTITRPSCMY